MVGVSASTDLPIEARCRSQCMFGIPEPAGLRVDNAQMVPGFCLGGGFAKSVEDLKCRPIP